MIRILQLYGYFKRQTSKISLKKTGICIRKKHLQRETESFLQTTQKDAIRTNYVKTKIDKTQ